MTEALTLSIMSTLASPCHRHRLHLTSRCSCLLKPEKKHLNAFVYRHNRTIRPKIIIFMQATIYDVDLTELI